MPDTEDGIEEEVEEDVEDFCQSCSEFWHLIPNVGKHMGLAHMFSMNQSNWATNFTHWIVLQLLVYIVVACAWYLVVFMHTTDQHTCYRSGLGSGPCVRVAFWELIYGVIGAYIVAHLGWFCIVKQHGCCSPLTILIWGILYILWGIQWILLALTYVNTFEFGFIGTILYGIYGICLVYCGISAVKIYNQGGAGKEWRGHFHLESS